MHQPLDLLKDLISIQVKAIKELDKQEEENITQVSAASFL